MMINRLTIGIGAMSVWLAMASTAVHADWDHRFHGWHNGSAIAWEDQRRAWRRLQRQDRRWRERQWRHNLRQDRWLYDPFLDPFGRRQNWQQNRLGTGVLGSALTYQLIRSLDDRCDCDDHRNLEHRATNCFRLERLPGGRERRVPLPASACY